jgi:hypothetical protein
LCVDVRLYVDDECLTSHVRVGLDRAPLSIDIEGDISRKKLARLLPRFVTDSRKQPSMFLAFLEEDLTRTAWM